MNIKMETVEEIKNRMKDRLGYMIINPSGGIRTEDGSILSIRSSLKRDTFEIAKEYIDFHLPENIVEELVRISVTPDSDEKEQLFNQLCDSIFIDLRNFIRNTGDSANMGEPWHHLIRIDQFLHYKRSHGRMEF